MLYHDNTSHYHDYQDIFFISNKMLHTLFYKRLLARNVSLFTFSGKRHDLFTLTILPVQLKALSEGTDVEGMQRYFRAKLAIWGSWDW